MGRGRGGWGSGENWANRQLWGHLRKLRGQAERACGLGWLTAFQGHLPPHSKWPPSSENLAPQGWQHAEFSSRGFHWPCSTMGMFISGDRLIQTTMPQSQGNWELTLSLPAALCHGKPRLVHSTCACAPAVPGLPCSARLAEEKCCFQSYLFSSAAEVLTSHFQVPGYKMEGSLLTHVRLHVSSSRGNNNKLLLD